MAPVSRYDHDNIEQKLKDTIQSLYQILVQVSAYDSATSTGTPGPSSNPQSRDVLAAELRTLTRSLQAVHAAAGVEGSLPAVPPELVHYVEGGRNPDIYTREFVELVRRGNQLMRGKQAAFASFRDVLAAEMAAAMPELRDDAARVVAATTPGLAAGGSAAAGGAGAPGGGGGGGGGPAATMGL
ncbi:hypothetical protein DL764_010329 [Monosporascus ibericus]|uniref:Mediator of RNA polymerase II transcription subunit 10 n=1 Tax=Monosporascus ibericus TaxID=155417 RepID=A0A4V1X8Q5_9PEZI|nr:hypothetical protein DL764_010329 [Monosporascus ibericus]